jgi:hypothetical protein
VSWPFPDVELPWERGEEELSGLSGLGLPDDAAGGPREGSRRGDRDQNREDDQDVERLARDAGDLAARLVRLHFRRLKP